MSPVGRRRGFGATWWGKAWTEALEQRARLDPNRLPRGRSYARRGTVSDLLITPGEVHANVQGSRARPYSVVVRVRAFTAAEWERVLEAVAAQLGRTAALLDGELPPGVAEDVRAAGCDLLPGAGEVQPRCSCPDWADPCKHAAAVCYLVADALDADPFALLLLRGRSRDQVLGALRARRTPSGGAAAHPSATDGGVDARAAYARAVAALLAVPLPPAHPGRPAALAVAPPPDSGVAANDLVALASDAAARAWQLATGDGDGGLGLTFDEDLARRAALALAGGGLDALARAAGMRGRELTRWAVAWREGGADGLAVLRDSWDAAPDEMAEGVAALRSTPGLVGRLRVTGSRVTLGRVQLRLGCDGLWYCMRRSGDGWDLAGPPDPDPVAALTACDT